MTTTSELIAKEILAIANGVKEMREGGLSMKPHDWRHATDAPGWKLGDACVRCEKCQLKAIANSPSGDRG